MQRQCSYCGGWELGDGTEEADFNPCVCDEMDIDEFLELPFDRAEPVGDMDVRYAEWIDKNFPDRISAYGKCKEATASMVAAFPELKRKSGQVFIDQIERETLHWWCEDENGNIIDPTVRQYTDAGYFVLGYEEYPEDHVARHHERAKCMECGEYFYRVPDVLKFSPTCSSECFKAFARSFT